jgi:hypothetical protein
MEIPEVEKIEMCFTCSLRYWYKLREFIKIRGFENEMEEIQFFKHKKPQFTGLIEYYIHCYRALLFIPAKGDEEMKLFWERELLKIDRFYVENAVIYQYYKTGNTNEDQRWFLRQGGDESSFLNTRVFDPDDNIVTSHDWLISLIIANEKYREFVYEKLNSFITKN